MDESKTCASCARSLPVAKFHKAVGSRDGRRSSCKECARARRFQRLGKPVEPRPRRDADGKTCPQCRTYKLWDEFYRCRSAYDGRDTYCGDCKKKRAADEWATKGDERREYARRRRASRPLVEPDPAVLRGCTRCGLCKPQTEFSRRRTNADGFSNRCKACDKAASRKYRAENKAILRQRKRAKVYGLDHQRYELQLAAQGGGCAICGSTKPSGRSVDVFSVDHCHATGAVRGLLCSHCNTGLGMFKDDPGLLHAALAYLANPPLPALTG